MTWTSDVDEVLREFWVCYDRQSNLERVQGPALIGLCSLTYKKVLFIELQGMIRYWMTGPFNYKI